MHTLRRLELPFSDADSFLETAESWLLKAEAENNLLLSLADRLRRSPSSDDGPVYLAAVEVDGVVKGCAFRTPPWKVGLTRIPLDAIPALVEDVADAFEVIPGVLGPEGEVALFASEWNERRGTSAEIRMRQGIYQLERVIPPARPPAGSLRVARPDDYDLAVVWANGFVEETRVDQREVREPIRDKIESGNLWFWDDGEPRPMAAEGGRTPHGARINWVFTPNQWRSRGYASACVAQLSQQLIEAGSRFCFLYTDLSNPTSNLLYQRIGYQEVCEVVDCRVHA